MPETVTIADLWSLAPESLLTIWGLLVLVLDFTLLRGTDFNARRHVLGSLSLVGALVALAVVLYTADYHGSSFLDGSVAHDAITSWFDGLIVVLMALVLVLSISNQFTEHWGEYYALILWAGVGMMVLISALELVLLFLALEMMTICLYLLTAFVKKRRRSSEAGLKYFVYGSVSSALFLFGLSWVYGLTGSTRIESIRMVLESSDHVAGLAGNVAGAVAVLLLMVGFGFKVAAVPFHQWAPDAYVAAPSPITAWISTGSKVASFIALLRVMVHGLAPWAHREGNIVGPGWVGVIALISAASMTYGNFAALAQTNFKRLLAYSSIAHAGYMLVGVLAASVSVDQGHNAAGAVLFNLVIYAFSKLGSFALATWLMRDLGDEDLAGLDGLGHRSPTLAVCAVLLLLSLVGVPPLAGFFGKLSMFMEALNTGPNGRLTLLWLVALALATTVLSAFYYTRILRAMFLRPPPPNALGPPNVSIGLPIVVCTIVLVVLSLQPDLLFEPMTRAAGPLIGEPARGGATVPDLSLLRSP
jgi:NADH-quinone oxidoreductase subunit N